MRLILLSKHFIEPAQNTLREFTGKINSNIRLAFCCNAGDVFKSSRKDYIQVARQELIKSGYKLIDLDLNKESNEIYSVLSQVDATFFTGGSFYHLMSLFDSSGLSKNYKSLLDQGLIHIGFSAGAMICSKDFKAYDYLASYKYIKIKEGLNLFSYYIIPHYFDKPKYTKAFEISKKKHFNRVIPLTNHQAVIVKNKKWRIIQ